MSVLNTETVFSRPVPMEVVVTDSRALKYDDFALLAGEFADAELSQ